MLASEAIPPETKTNKTDLPQVVKVGKQKMTTNKEELSKWMACDESGCEIEIEAGAAREAAQQYVDGGDYGSEESKTKWVKVWVWPAAGDRREDAQSYRIEITPTEPECFAGEHDWQSPHSIVGGIRENPGVHGHGGGVVISECCMHCGCQRITDTWAQDSSNGEQGLESIEYVEGEYADALRDRAEKWVRDHSDENDLDEEELTAAFRQLFAREPDDDDRKQGLWSHLCSTGRIEEEED